jgi:acetoin utilization deacetylase AcuC-like enzyme
MISFFSEAHQLHAPEYEFYRGQRVPCFEQAVRATYVQDQLLARGHELREPDIDSMPVLRQIHTTRYLDFLQTAWSQWLALDSANASQQPFPSVWPVRSLRSDVQPDNFIAKLGLFSMDNGTPMAEGTWLAVKAAADAAASAAVALVQGEKAVFCATRPPGHHAGADFMGGYCFLNNAAVAAQALLGLGHQRIAILDVDYHHGNGTQSIFYERSDVLFVSLHGDPRTEFPFYLGHADESGLGAGSGFNLNLPLPAACSSLLWFETLELACHRVAQHDAQALVVSLGLDTFEGDPISKFSLQSSDFVRLGQRLAQIGLPTIFVLEGGYATQELGLNTVNVIDGFEFQAKVSA